MPHCLRYFHAAAQRGAARNVAGVNRHAASWRASHLKDEAARRSGSATVVIVTCSTVASPARAISHGTPCSFNIVHTRLHTLSLNGLMHMNASNARPNECHPLSSPILCSPNTHSCAEMVQPVNGQGKGANVARHRLRRPPPRPPQDQNILVWENVWGLAAEGINAGVVGGQYAPHAYNRYTDATRVIPYRANERRRRPPPVFHVRRSGKVLNVAELFTIVTACLPMASRTPSSTTTEPILYTC